ncbi:TPA: alpha/beta fold hydrolase [Candidatus Woesearchaeota archaeon]|nr:alpha/beta fold hydrolase [Candidatus Woesearchaeota archaeon]
MLLTVNYGLSEDEATIKTDLAQEVRSILVSLRDIDIEILAVEEVLRSEPRLRPGQLLGDLAGIGERFSMASVAMETVRALWAQEEYLRAREALDGSDVDIAMLSALRDEAAALRIAVQGLPAEHNALRDALHATRMQAATLMTDHAALWRDPYIAGPMLSLAERLNSTVVMYATGDYSRYGDMRQRVETLVSETATLNASFAQRESAVLLIGAAIVDDRNAAACALNMTAVLPCGNTTSNASLNSSSNISLSPNSSSNASSAASSIVSIAQVCDALSLLGNVSDNSSAQFTAVYCTQATLLPIDMTALDPVASMIDPVVESGFDITLPDASPLCCVFGDCNPCCSDASCADDPASYPIIFVHGHAFNGGNTPEYSLGAYFTSMQQALQRDGYIDAGIVTPSSTMSEVAEGEWGLSGKPVMARVTYYYNFYRNDDDYVLIAQKSENIETYSLRLNEMVNIVKHHTGKKKVNIVAHSMGGLVVRRYLQLFGEESVNKVVLIGTPNHGTEGRTRNLCGILGEDKECDDMEAGSVFLRKLDDPAMQPATVRFTTIAGTGCTVNGKDADGVATVESVALDFADNHLVSGSCEDLFGTELHSKMLDVVAYPQVYAIVRAALSS